jgi:hypothetical protein
MIAYSLCSVRCAECAMKREDVDSADSTRGKMLADEHCTNAPWDTFPRWHRHAETVYLPQTFPARGNHSTGKSSPPDQAGSCRVRTVLLIAHSPVEPFTHLLLLPLLRSIQERCLVRRKYHACSTCQESTFARARSTSSRSNGFSMCISFRLSISPVTSSDETLLMRMAGIPSSPGVACSWS